MEVALLIARLFLALVFGVAGIAKAADRRGSRQALVEFGVPEPLADVAARCLPFAELLVAVALIPLTTAWWAGIGALALLLVFTAGITASLARGQSPDCRCFGQLHSAPVSWATFARNAALAAVAVFVVAAGHASPGLSALDWVNDLRTAELINLVFGVFVTGLLAIITIFLNRVLKQQAELASRVEAIKAALSEDEEDAPVERKEAHLPGEGLPVGAMAPNFFLSSIADEKVSLEGLLEHGKPVLLVFAGPNCWGCKILLPMVRVWERDYGDRLIVAVLSNGSFEDNQDKMARYEISNLLLDKDSAVADEYQAHWTPAAVMIHPNGKIASQNNYGDDAIRQMVRDFMASGQFETGSSNGKGATGHIPQVALRHSVRKLGEMAPRFSLPDLSGRVVDSADLIGSPTLFIFWHPLCGFCSAMLDELRDLEEHPPKGAPEMVFIASGELEDIKAVNRDFKSLTLLDPSLEIGPLFGTKFTPSAILIDEQGRVASSLAIGEPNVRALVGLRKSKEMLTAQV